MRPVALAALLLLTAPALAADWPGFRGPDRDGRSAETGLDWAWPGGGPPVGWQVPLGEGYAMASIAGGRVFVFDHVDGRERLRALDADDGRELWSASYAVEYDDAFGFSDGPRANPLVGGERVVTFGVTGRLRCHAVKDGALRWDVDTGARYGVVTNFFGVGSNPVVHRGLVIATVGGSPPDSPSIDSGKVAPNGSALVAFDLATGEERWRAGDGLASYSSPVVVGEGDAARGYALLRGGLVSFDPDDGRPRGSLPWRAKKLYSVNAATPVVVGDRVFVTESYGPGGMLARADGDRLVAVWRDGPREKSIAAHWGTPVHHDGYLYGSHGENRGSAELRAVRVDDGAVAWRVPGLGRSTVILADGRLVVLGEEGRLLVAPISPERFEPIADVVPRGASGEPLLAYPAWNAPAIADGRLYARGSDRLVCFDLRPTRAGSE